MNTYAEMTYKLQSASVAEQLQHLYGSREGTLENQTARYTRILKRHENEIGTGNVSLISAPGRTEIGGNHTDHNRGRVLAAAVNLDCLAAVSPRTDMIATLRSDGYPPLKVDLSDLSVHPEEKGTTKGLIRGVAAKMAELGYVIRGFDATATSTVASGSGLSSSAAFEVMVSAIFDELYNGFRMDFITRAKVSQYAENVYFGKPCGLLDQMASASGGLVTVDFKDDDPAVRRLSYNFADKGYALVVVGTGGSHADLTDDYAAIPAEMKAVAAALGGKVLRDVPYEKFAQAIPQLRKQVSDRALLRAMHFYAENLRVDRQVSALESDDIESFFKAIIESGRSSYMYLQNVYATPKDESLCTALAMAESMLSGRGAWRVHGGGFAGTTLNFVPGDRLNDFISLMDASFGKGASHVLDIRPEGAAVIRF